MNASYRILLVDDDPAQRTMQHEIFSDSGFDLVEASNGAEALAFLATGEFDVVLLDRCMPGMSGDQVCHAIRHELKDAMLPVIVVTGSGSVDVLADCLAQGATDFIRKPYSPLELRARVQAAASHKRVTDQLESAESVLFALARMVEAKDGNTGDHCSRLSHAAVVFGQELGLRGDELTALRRGGVLHDIGKLGIPDEILLKPAGLTPNEWAIMRRHPIIGAELCRNLKSMRLTLDIIRSHHERWDGSGYPDGLSGTNIPLLARVFQIVDIFDALSFARPYKKALSRPEVIAVLRSETQRGWRDPELMAAFFDILEHRPESLVWQPDSGPDLGQRIFESVTHNAAFPQPSPVLPVCRAV